MVNRAQKVYNNTDTVQLSGSKSLLANCFNCFLMIHSFSWRPFDTASSQLRFLSFLGATIESISPDLEARNKSRTLRIDSFLC